MKVKLEQFLAVDSATKTTIEALALAVNRMDRPRISNALRASDKLKEVLANNFVRRRKYTSLCRGCVQKNRLPDSYIVHHFLIGACVNTLATGIAAGEPSDGPLNRA